MNKAIIHTTLESTETVLSGFLKSKAKEIHMLNEMHTFNLHLFQKAYIWMHKVAKIWTQLQT